MQMNFFNIHYIPQHHTLRQNITPLQKLGTPMPYFSFCLKQFMIIAFLWQATKPLIKQ